MTQLMTDSPATTDFLGVYDNAICSNTCASIIELAEQTPQSSTLGHIGQAIDKSKKDSFDWCISESSEWVQFNQLILDTTIDYMVRYIREYPFLICGPLTPTIFSPDGEFELTHENIDRLSDDQLRSVVLTFYRCGLLNLQKYSQGTGGYHHWHSEVHPREADCETLHRVLLFMFFLNDVTEGGETEFFYQNQKIQPKAGRMVIAPAGFTHTHKGHVSISDDKYIVTSWVLFQRAERLFAQV